MQTLAVKRREFITFVGGAAAWPLTARAQQRERVRRVGVLDNRDESDRNARAEIAAFAQALAELGWTEGRNLRMDIRWANMEQARTYAKELVDLKPDVILAVTTPATAAIQSLAGTIPVVFVQVTDPVGSGFAASVPRPGGNMTGFAYLEPSLGDKWLELLKEMAPGVKRVAYMFNPNTAPFVRSTYGPAFEAAARALKIQPIASPVGSEADIDAAITALGREPGSGLIVMPDGWVTVHRKRVIALAAQQNVPTVYHNQSFARDGGLLSYGPEFVHLMSRAAAYVDRILRGEKPADLPVQMPAKFLMVLNAKTAKALGVTIPPSF